MNPSIQYLIKAVVASLEGEVLPHLDPQAKPASNVRACLMLLANIEARVTQEARDLFDDNRELRPLLEEAATHAGTLGIEACLRDALLGSLRQYPAQENYFDAARAAEENRAHQELLTQVINRLPAASGDKAAFRNKLHRYLGATAARELQLAQQALGRVPI